MVCSIVLPTDHFPYLAYQLNLQMTRTIEDVLTADEDDRKPHCYWVFTLNNPREEDKAILENMECQRLLVGLEHAPTTGTPHYQGFVGFKKPCKFGGLKRLFAGRAHWAPSMCEGSMNYAIKENVFVARDNRQQGKRSDLDETVEYISKKPRTAAQIAKKFPKQMIKYHKGLERTAYLMHKMEYPLREAVWIWGRSGTGKTRFAMAAHARTEKIVMQGSHFIQGYTGAPVCVIDEYRGDWPFDLLLGLLDLIPHPIGVKGATDMFAPRVVIVTSPHHPEHYIPRLEENVQLMRRLGDRVYQFPQDYERCDTWLASVDFDLPPEEAED